jgi:hypothetical protein
VGQVLPHAVKEPPESTSQRTEFAGALMQLPVVHAVEQVRDATW